MDIVARGAGGLLGALFVFGVDLDGRRGSLIELDQIRFAVDGHDPVAVRGLRIGDVVAPLKGLHGVLGRWDRRPWRQTFVFELEPLDPSKPEALEYGASGVKLGALDRKAEKVLALGLLARHEIPSQRDDVQPADSAHRKDRSLIDVAHGLSSWPGTSRHRQPQPTTDT